MNLYPAIDILQGQAVRLRQGRREEVTVYGTPLEMARRWVRSGARWLHVVDLDGAFAGSPRNTAAIEAIRAECGNVRIQTGGGIRDRSAIERLLSIGVDRIILGTAAVEDPGLLGDALDRFGDRVAVAIDARDGTVRLKGWTADAALTAVDLARDLERAGVGTVVYTDIARDGLLEGVNVEATLRLLEATSGLRVIASGGIAGLADLARLRDLDHPRLEGAILGKALYEERLDLAEALRAMDEETNERDHGAR